MEIEAFPNRVLWSTIARTLRWNKKKMHNLASSSTEAKHDTRTYE